MKKLFILSIFAFSFALTERTQAQCLPSITVTKIACDYNKEQFEVKYENPGSDTFSVNVKCSNCGVSECVKLPPTTGKSIVHSERFSSCKGDITSTVFMGPDCDGPPCVALPVTLINFTAQRNGTTVVLQWQTANEFNNTGFYVEKSKDAGLTWKEGDFIESKAKATGGNSSLLLDYQYVDNNPPTTTGNILYRLRQVDFDGRIAYSEIRAVTGNKQTVDMEVFPNPNKGTFYVQFKDANSARNITIVDVAGRVLKTWDSVRVSTITINDMSLRPGTYFLRVVSDNKTPTVQSFTVVN